MSFRPAAIASAALGIALAIAGAPGVAAGLPAAPSHEVGGAYPEDFVPPQIREVGVIERLGEKVPLDVVLTDQDGKQVTLGDRLESGRPVVLNLAYYGCPTLCGMVVKGFTDSLKALKYTPGTEFDVVTVSIDPTEKASLAAEKRQAVLEELGRPGAEKGWTFHVAEGKESQRLAKAVGFEYRWDAATRQWNHPAVVVVLTPDGTVSRYLYGVTWPPEDVKLAVLEASEGKVGSLADKVLLYCYTYDPKAGRYVLFAQNLMRAGGALTVLALAAFFFVQWRKTKHPALERT